MQFLNVRSFGYEWKRGRAEIEALFCFLLKIGKKKKIDPILSFGTED